MNRELIKAHVQYNDYLGSAAADHKDTRDYNQLLEEHNYHFDEYFPYAFSIGFYENPHIQDSDNVEDYSFHFTAHSVKKSEAGENNEDIQEYMSQHTSGIPTYRFSIRINVRDFFNLFKRFEVVLHPYLDTTFHFSDSFEQYIIDEISLDISD